MSSDAQFREAHALHLAGDFAEAERRYLALVAAKPLWAHHNLGVLYMKIGRDAEAEAAYRAALAADPASEPTRHMLGSLLLRMGRFEEGWPLYEARRRYDSKITRPNLPYPEWRGEDLAGKHLVVVREQGFGDQIMFARFLPELAGRAAKVTYVCSPNLVRLFQGLGANLVPASHAPPPAAADFWIPDCSLGLRLGLTVQTIPSAPYLFPAPLTRGGGIGVMVKGSATNLTLRHRTMPQEAATELLALGRELSPEATGAKDFLDTARIIAGLDLVISIDTAVAHLAAAMGKPTWILLPPIETDWRWLNDRSDNPWYASARLFRQPGLGHWGRIVSEVAREARASGLP